jgi:hypothetical protein
MPIEHLNELTSVYRCPVCGLIRNCPRLMWIDQQMTDMEYEMMDAVDFLEWMCHPKAPSECLNRNR